MPDPFVRKTYLHAAADPEWPVRFSIGKRTRALQLQSFLKTLSAAAGTKMPPETAQTALSLVVLAQGDWRRQLSAPYGWGLTRRTGEEVVLAAPASYQPRLVARFDLKADRATGQLLVQASWCEPGEEPGAVAEAAATELRRMARWQGLSEVVVVPRGDLARRLAGCVPG